jgi:hypothetical protein
LHPNSSPLAEAERQLELQKQLIGALTPELYRQLALYLQVLRKGLLHAVQQACFHLATQTYPERFTAIGPSRRLELQERLLALVQRCNCLLTVEQLIGLAAQLQSRQQRQWRRDQQRLLLALAAEQDRLDDGDEEESEDAEPEHQDSEDQEFEDQDSEDADSPEGDGGRFGRSGEGAFAQPRGSVHLGLDLPLSADLFGEGLEGLGAWLAGFAASPESAPPTSPESASWLGEGPGPSAPGTAPDLAGDEPQDPGEGNVQSAADAEPDPARANPPQDPAAASLLPDEQGQEPDPVDQSAARGEPNDTIGFAAELDQPSSGSDSGGALRNEASPFQGDALEPDAAADAPPGPEEPSGSSLQDPDDPDPGASAPPPGVSPPARPEGARDGEGHARRPPLRRGPGAGSARQGGRQRRSAPEGASDDFQFFQSLFAMAAEGLGRESAGLASPPSGEVGPTGARRPDSAPTQSDSPEFGPRDSAQGQEPGDGGAMGPGAGPGPSESAAAPGGLPQGAVAIPLELLRQAGRLGKPPDPAIWQAQGSLMPQDAPSLLAWWEALDGALQRRLRNLSNAVNGELVRLGITRSHLPIALLDAVLKGQVDPLPAPANLVRLQMPFGGDPSSGPGDAGAVRVLPLGGGMDMVVLLLRPADLEFEAPALRVCRRRLEQSRARLRTMAQRHRYWQRRVQALEAERQWFQDSPNPSP